MAKEKKMNLLTASLDDLKGALKAAEADHESCSGRPCWNCASNQVRYENENLEGCDCAAVRRVLKILISVREDNTQKTQNRSCNGCCDSCKWLNSEMLKKSGYRFCLHWHNFTIRDGFCYAYEGVENP